MERWKIKLKEAWSLLFTVLGRLISYFLSSVDLTSLNFYVICQVQSELQTKFRVLKNDRCQCILKI